ncbi:MAG TPA: hypothetical protein VK623_03340 [Flavobacterium sp.]|nr:hypothetical protein [Flavobacterium sp.]
MKKLNYLFTSILFFAFAIAQAQATSKTQTPPLVDPLTNCAIRYYYYPNLEAYYDTKKNIYIFNQKGQWIAAQEIPAGYRGYSLYNKVSVFITDYDDENPTQFISQHKKKYPYMHKGRPTLATASIGD